MTINFDIESHVGKISCNDEYSKQVNIGSWNGRKSVIDIRQWRGDKPLKGITLNKDEAAALVKLLQEAMAAKELH